MNEELFARKIVEVLDSASQEIDGQTLDQLAVARRKAVAVLEQPRGSWLLMPRPVLAGWNRLAELTGHGGYRIWLPLLVILAVFVAVASSRMGGNNQPIDADALLLASDLPPEAFADKEFVAWLEQSSHP